MAFPVQALIAAAMANAAGALPDGVAILHQVSTNCDAVQMVASQSLMLVLLFFIVCCGIVVGWWSSRGMMDK